MKINQPIHTQAMPLFAVGSLAIQNVNPMFTDFQNRSTLDIAGQPLGFGSQADPTHNRNNIGTGFVAYVSNKFSPNFCTGLNP